MKKIFTLLTAALASMCMWADITWTAPQSADQVDYYMTMDDGVSLMAFKNKTGSNTTPEEKTDKWSVKTSNSGGFWIVPAADVSKITISYLCGSTNSSNTQYKIQSSNFGTDLNSASSVEFAVKSGSEKNVWFDVEIIIAMTAGQHLYVKFPTNVYISKVILSTAPTCSNPAQALALAANKTTGLYEGDTVTFSITGGNGAATTLAGAASEVITNNQWIATVGEHTFTLSQEVNNGICGGEDQVVLTVAQKTPVTAAVVTGASAAYVGDEVTLTCEAANAATYQWYQGANAISGATNATYTFTPDAAGTYTFACAASNEFTATPVKSADFTVTVTVKPAEPTMLVKWDATPANRIGVITYGPNSIEEGEVKIHSDAEKVKGIKFGSSYNYADGKYVTFKPATGGFEEGDVVSLAVCYNNSGEKNAAISLYAADGATLLYSTPNGVNGKTSAADPTVETYTLEYDADSLFIGRLGNTSTFVTLLQVVRPVDVGGDPTLKVNTNAANIKATAAEPTATAKVIFSGKHLAAGTYNLSLTQVAGLSVSPTSITVPENGKFSQEVTISFTATQDVSMNMAELSLTIGELTQSVLISYSAKMSHEYGKSIDFEQFVTENGKAGDFTTALAEANYIASLSGFSLDSLDSEKDANNEPYLGLKIKAAGGYLGCWLHKGDTINIKFGKVSANVLFTAGNYPELTKTPEDLANPFVFTAEEADIFVKLQTTTGDAVVLKHILITGKQPEPQAIIDAKSATEAVKVLRNGQLLILRGDKVYTVTGMEL